MNTLGKTFVALGVCVVIILTLFFSRDFGAPYGYKGDGFGTKQEAIEDGIGASYTIEEEIGTIEFDDGVIYVCKTKDNNLVISYMFLNKQQTKFYLEKYFIDTDLEKAQWHSSENKIKTNYRLADVSQELTTCDNKPVEYEDFTVKLYDEVKTVRVYYNRAE